MGRVDGPTLGPPSELYWSKGKITRGCSDWMGRVTKWADNSNLGHKEINMHLYWVMGLLLTLASVVKPGISCTTSCQHPANQTAPLKFVDADPDLDLYTKPDHWFDIGCCADGFTDIQWYFRKLDTLTWTLWPWVPPCDLCAVRPYNPELCDRGQKIEFTPVYKHRDAGDYRCLVTNNITGQMILREFHLDIEECHEDPEGGIKYDPPQSPVYANLSSNMTLTCKGYFGCPTRNMARHANWSYTDGSGFRRPLLPNNEDGHFRIHYYSSTQDIRVGSLLTIVGVRKSDYHLTFHCRLSAETEVKEWEVNISAIPVDEINLKMIIIIASSLAVVMLAGTVLYCCHKPQVDYMRRTLLGQLPEKGPAEASYYDAVIIHHEDNRGLVEDAIQKPLRQEHYNIFTKDCVMGGQGEVCTFTDAIARSMCIIVVLSDKELDFVETQFHLGVAISCPKIVPMVVVEVQVGNCSLDSSCKKDVLKHLPKITTSVQWRGRKNMSRRQIDNFLYSIKSNLPLPTKHTGKANVIARHNSNSTTTPLIPVHEHTSVATARHSSTGSGAFNGSTCRQTSDDTVQSDTHVEGRDNVFEEPRTPLLVSSRAGVQEGNTHFAEHCPPKTQWSNDSGYAKSPSYQGRDQGDIDVTLNLAAPALI